MLSPPYVFAFLVGDGAGSLAGRLAGCLALATAFFSGDLECWLGDGFDLFQFFHGTLLCGNHKPAKGLDLLVRLLHFGEFVNEKRRPRELQRTVSGGIIGRIPCGRFLLCAAKDKEDPTCL